MLTKKLSNGVEVYISNPDLIDSKEKRDEAFKNLELVSKELADANIMDEGYDEIAARYRAQLGYIQQGINIYSKCEGGVCENCGS